jgi:hypothetical protein
VWKKTIQTRDSTNGGSKQHDTVKDKSKSQEAIKTVVQIITDRDKDTMYEHSRWRHKSAPTHMYRAIQYYNTCADWSMYVQIYDLGSGPDQTSINSTKHTTQQTRNAIL